MNYLNYWKLDIEIRKLFYAYVQWTEFLQLNEDGHVTDEEIIERISAQAPNHCAELIYTVGLYYAILMIDM